MSIANELIYSLKRHEVLVLKYKSFSVAQKWFNCFFFLKEQCLLYAQKRDSLCWLSKILMSSFRKKPCDGQNFQRKKSFVLRSFRDIFEKYPNHLSRLSKLTSNPRIMHLKWLHEHICVYHCLYSKLYLLDIAEMVAVFRSQHVQIPSNV